MSGMVSQHKTWHAQQKSIRTQELPQSPTQQHTYAQDSLLHFTVRSKGTSLRDCCQDTASLSQEDVGKGMEYSMYLSPRVLNDQHRRPGDELVRRAREMNVPLLWYSQR